MKVLFRSLLFCAVFIGVIFSQSQFEAQFSFPDKNDSYSIVNGDTLLDVYLSPDQQTITYFQQNLGKVKSSSGSVAMGSIPLRQYLSLDTNRYKWISITKILHSQLDQSQKVINAGIGRTASNMTGEGVIVGIVDIGGLDSQNDDFKKTVDGNNVSRILRLWDQTVEGTHPNSTTFNYGNEWTETNMNNCNVTDPNVGHGTMVTGIAAGSGLATGNNQAAGKYVGIAPMADIIFVKTDGKTYKVIDGIKYIIEKANEVNKPCIINLSIGINTGPKNGTSPFESSIGKIVSDEDKLMIVAAGNNQDKNKHVLKSSAGTITFNLSQSKTDVNYNYTIEIFYPSYTNYTISIEPPHSNARLYDFTHSKWVDYFYLQNYTFSSGEGTGDYPQNGWVCEDGGVKIHNNDFGNKNPYPNTNLRCIQLNFSPVDQLGVNVDLEQGDWKINMSGGTNSYDAYIYNDWDIDINFKGDVTLSHNVIEPGNVESVLTVGSMNSKNTWNSLNGQIPVQSDYQLNLKSNFSSEGPTRDGITKPEIYAPGAWIMSSKSSTGTYTNDFVDPDGVHVIGTGTSYAAPHVTGAVALLLQQNANLTPAEIKEKLVNTANNNNGYPLLDVKAALCKDGTCTQNPAAYIPFNFNTVLNNRVYSIFEITGESVK